MKKLNILASLFVGALAFTACEDDNDSNPIIQQPETFTVNTPSWADRILDLERNTTFALTYSQPEYGYTAAVTYSAELTLEDTWQEEVAATDTTEAIAANYVKLDGSSTTYFLDLNTSVINRYILETNNWTSEELIPADSVAIYVRVKAALASGYSCYSNTVKLKVLPYFIPLTYADPEMWFLIGSCIANGSWSNGSAADIGVSLIPLNSIEGGEYDPVTGQGPLTYTGYFPADQGFKLIKTPGSWDSQWGSSSNNSIDSPVKNDGGSGDFKVTAAGYYTVSLNTKTNELVITPAEESKVYDHMFISGDFNGWATDVQMTPVSIVEGVENHDWTFELDATGGATTAKFLYDGWSPNWGNTGFPFGTGAGNGPNIPVEAGNYTVVFNDITGYYHFFSK